MVALISGYWLSVAAVLHDFQADTLSTFGIEVQPPDKLIDNLFNLDQAAVVAAAQKQRGTLKNPPIDVDRYLAILSKRGLSRTVRNLTGFRSVLWTSSLPGRTPSQAG